MTPSHRSASSLAVDTMKLLDMEKAVRKAEEGDCPVLISLMDEIKQLKKKVRKLKKKLAIL